MKSLRMRQSQVSESGRKVIGEESGSGRTTTIWRVRQKRV